MLPIQQLCPGVRPSGDNLTFFVRSASGGPDRVVDLASYGGSGFCSCEDYQFRVQPALAQGEAVTSENNCPHIQQAWAYYSITMVQRLLKLGIAHDAAEQSI